MFHITELDYQNAYRTHIGGEEEFISSAEAFELGWQEACRVAYQEAEDAEKVQYELGFEQGSEEAYTEGKDDLRNDITAEVHRWAESLGYHIPRDAMDLFRNLDAMYGTDITPHIEARRPR
jgi:hypothetical protein